MLLGTTPKPQVYPQSCPEKCCLTVRLINIEIPEDLQQSLQQRVAQSQKRTGIPYSTILAVCCILFKTPRRWVQKPVINGGPRGPYKWTKINGLTGRGPPCTHKRNGKQKKSDRICDTSPFSNHLEHRILTDNSNLLRVQQLIMLVFPNFCQAQTQIQFPQLKITVFFVE